MEEAHRQETQPLAQNIMQDLLDNIDAAEAMKLPVCQDTGMAVVFVRLGQEVHITAACWKKRSTAGYPAVISTAGALFGGGGPLRRVNTGDNTPAVLHLTLTAGDRLEIMVAPKGFGSENMSRIYMLTPAADREKVIACICDAAQKAGSNPCPPMVLGVGIGGDFEMCALLAKRALCRPLDQPHPDAYYAQMERDALTAVNALGRRPAGIRCVTTALGVSIRRPIRRILPACR